VMAPNKGGPKKKEKGEQASTEPSQSEAPASK
jgi:hypothetical protein